MHHSTAHQVVQTTIDALGADLLDAGATQAATYIICGLGAAGARGAGAGAGGRAGAGAGGGRGGSEDRRSRIEIDLYDDVAEQALGVGADRAVTTVTLRSSGAELAALRAAGPPYLPGWGEQGVLVVLGDETDWVEVAELLTESYRLLAPGRLTARLAVPGQARAGP